MLRRNILKFASIAFFLANAVAFAQEAEKTKPLRVLMIAGGCCHDYPVQNLIINQGVSQRANVEFEVFHGVTDRNRKLPIYSGEDWCEGYDIVIHNECYGGVTDVEFVEQIVRGHVKHKVPAVVIHCSMHSYREAQTDAWRQLLGVTSRRHEKGGVPLDIIARSPDHPILKGIPAKWDTQFGELYVIEKTWPNTQVLCTAHGVQTEQDHPVVWTNEYEGVRLFGTTLGHHNDTMLNENWLDTVARGVLWACDKLDSDGNIAAGYEGTGAAPILLPGIAKPDADKSPTPAE